MNSNVEILEFDVNVDYKHLLNQSEKGVIIIRDMPNAFYHRQGWALSSSGAKHLDESPSDFFYHCVDHEFPQEQAQPLIFGSVTHTAVTEPHKLKDEVKIIPDTFNIETEDSKGKIKIKTLKFNGNTQEAEDYRKEYFEKNKEFYCITNEDFEHIKNIKKQAEKNDLLQTFLNDPETLIEVSIFWKQILKDAKGNVIKTQRGEPVYVYCRCRPDILVLSQRINCDIKTFGLKAGGKVYEEFAKRIYDSSYYLSCAHYSYGIEKAFGFKPKHILYVVTKTPPYSQVSFSLGVFNHTLMLGTMDIENIYMTYNKCLFDSFFKPIEIDMPDYIIRRKQKR